MGIHYSLEGKTAIVTGSRRGIGKAIALAFARAGADVIVCDDVSDTGELASLAEEIKKIGCRSLAVQTDVSSNKDVNTLIGLANEIGGVDILVNNAAVLDNSWLMDLNEEVWDRVMDVNLKGVYLCSQAVAKDMIKRNKKGTIISLASVGGLESGALRPRRNPTSAYLVSKAGIILFTRMLARQIGGNNIRVNAIAPGIVKTDIVAKDGKQPSWSDPEVLKLLNSLVPLGRMAEPDDIADVALFLACDASRYINGVTIVVDGGMIA